MDAGAELEHTMEYKILKAYMKRRRPKGTTLEIADHDMQKVSCKRVKKRDDGAVEVADQLMKIADSVPISSIEKGDIEADGPEEDVIQEIVELLKESGDKLNEEVKNKNLAQRMQDIFDYDFFKKVTDTFLQHMGSYGNPTAKKAEIALAVEVTSRMTAMGNHPMNRVLGFGVKYLQENHSAWIQQHGGWDNAFDSNKDDEVH
ncbi:apoptosis facilitator Bcl-2-like protein 14 isoform X4 [Brienomyrus brachyistius]|uniref:apoptosis facilitator Bcl-2-like protein 14 isoform X4 n=1 Tax=Brienomyrus brachyistius TaxID=42636 RepID=UPI0020B1C070|nr:apoptosis facilitator Bcl-2-like protein 14 isoform X4 [Brienomyrus brachyistius]